MKNKFMNYRYKKFETSDSDTRLLDRDWFNRRWVDRHYAERDWFHQKWVHKYKFDKTR